jgi:hypothetical protein
MLAARLVRQRVQGSQPGLKAAEDLAQGTGPRPSGLNEFAWRTSG